MTAEAVSGLAGILTVAAGTSLGAIARFEVSRMLVDMLGDRFPWPTLVVNVAGCGLAALLYGLLDSSGMVAALLLAGILGGFTTVSTFGLETILLWQRGRHFAAAAYIMLSLVLCLLATLAGLGWKQ